MSTSRIAQLQEFFEEDPKDPFNIYALALEYQKHDLTKAKELFDQLLEEHESYLPAYYHAAKLHQDSLNDRDRAIDVYEKGIALAKKIQDHKALRELQSAYQELLFE